MVKTRSGRSDSERLLSSSDGSPTASSKSHPSTPSSPKGLPTGPSTAGAAKSYAEAARTKDELLEEYKATIKRLQEERKKLIHRTNDFDLEMALRESELETLRQANVELQEGIETLQSELEQRTASEAEKATRLATLQEVGENFVAGKTIVSALAKPCPFSGLKHDKLDIRDWLQSMIDYITTARLAATEQQRIQIAESYLQGEAKRSWLISRKAMTNGSTNVYEGLTFDMFADCLVKRWDPACTEIVAQHKLDMLRQKGGLADFVAEFDKLCSYVPDMQDREKIHRFLTSIKPELCEMVLTDPTTRKRWTNYDDLRSYSLNHAATTTASAPAAVPPGLRPSSNPPSRHGYTQPRLKRQAFLNTGEDDRGFKRHKTDHHGRQQQQHQQRQPRPNIMVPMVNAVGDRFSRHYKLVAWCHGKSICCTCYKQYSDSTRDQHREKCRSKPAQGLPAGYSIPPRTGH